MSFPEVEIVPERTSVASATRINGSLPEGDALTDRKARSPLEVAAFARLRRAAVKVLVVLSPLLCVDEFPDERVLARRL